ncbi:TPA: hypothetical protein ACXI8G_000952 [Serratia marcescens]
MTVSTEVDREEYTGNGVTTDFDYRFRVFTEDQLSVSVVDLSENIINLTLNTDYSVTGAGLRSGGKVKLASPLAAGWKINIERDLPLTQETDVRNQGNFFPEVHEDAWDKLTMLIQQTWSFASLALRKPNWLAKFYDAQGNRISNLGDPVANQDAATKRYVDSEIADAEAGAAAALAQERQERIAADNAEQAARTKADIDIRNEITTNNKRNLRFGYDVDVMPDAATNANKLIGLNAQGKPVPVSADAGSNTELSLELADAGMPGGAGMVGWNGETVADALAGIMGKTLTRITNNGFFANWPQGKMFSWKGYAYMGWHAGGLHGSADADAYIIRTRDGVNFSDIFTVATHTSNEGAAWFSVGVTAEDTLIGIVRFRQGASDDSPIRHVFYRSSNGSSWTAGNAFTMTTASGATPTLYHGFCLLPNGNFITGYHAADGELGYVEINPNTEAYTKHVILTPAQNMYNGAVVHVELNFLRRDDTNKVLITSRSQFASYQNPGMWVLDVGTGSLSGMVPTGIPFSVNPVTPVFAPGYQRVLFVVANRYDSLDLTREQAGLWVYEASISDAFNMNWAGFRGRCVARLSGDLNSNAGVAGVQHACLHGDMVLIGSGCEVAGNADRSDVFMLKLDYRPSYIQTQTAFQTSGAAAAAPNGTTEFRLFDGAGRNARIRMNGLNLVNDSGTIFQFGFTNLNNGSRGIGFYTGEVTTPAIYIRSSGIAGNPVAMDFNRDINFAGGTFHYAPGARIRFNSNTSALGPSTIFYNSTNNRLEINSTSSDTAAIMYSRSTDILTLSRSDVGSAVNPAGLYLLASNDAGASSVTGGGSLGIAFNVSGYTAGAAMRVAQNGNILANTPVQKARYAVNALPTSGLISGAEAYATNGRRAGEGAGAGSGCPVWFDGTYWRTYYDNSIVAA